MLDLTYIAPKLQAMAIPLTELHHDPRNAKLHSRKNVDAVKANLQRFGQVQPIIVQKKGMIIRVGNCRFQAAKELGWTHLAALVLDYSDEEAIALAIADNRTSELGSWDDEVLQAELLRLQDAGFDLSDIGFDDSDLASILTNPADDLLSDQALPDLLVPPPEPTTYTFRIDGRLVELTREESLALEKALDSFVVATGHTDGFFEHILDGERN